MVKRMIVRTLLAIFCFGSIILAQSEVQKGTMYKVQKKNVWEVGCLFEFNESAEVFLVSDNPLQILYLQHLWHKSVVDPVGRIGGMLLTFKDGSFIIEGLGLEKDNEVEKMPPLFKDFEGGKPAIKYKDNLVFNIFPNYYWSIVPFNYGMFFVKADIDDKIGGEVFIKVEMPQDSYKLIMRLYTAYDMVLPEIFPEMGNEIGGKAVLKAIDYARPPFLIRHSDLDGDGMDEIIIGEGWYKTKGIFIWSRSVKHFYRLVGITDKIGSLYEWGDPETMKNSYLFEKGRITKINLK